MVYEIISTKNSQDTNWNKATTIWIWDWLCLDIHLLLHGRMNWTEKTFRNVYMYLYTFLKMHGNCSLLLLPKMPKGKKAEGKVVPAPVVKKQEAMKVVYPLFEKRLKNFGIGQDIQPKRDLTCFVKWSQYFWQQWKELLSVSAWKCLLY